jgi:hypothetical protein
MPTTNTDLIDRYLHAVKFWLPKAQQADIVAEIGEDLQSLVEEREAALGHTLDEDDVAVILKKRGSPLKVASSYLPQQRLINPAMLPVYRLVLKIVLCWVFVPLFAFVFLGPVLAFAHPGEMLLRCLVEYWRAAFMTVGMVTTVFALLDRYQVKFKHADDWNPRKLPRVPGTQDTMTRWNHLAGFIFGFAAAAFWVSLMWQRSEFSFSGGTRLIVGPVWKQIYWPVLGLTLVSAFFDLLSSLSPRWTRVRSRVRIGIDVCGLVIVAALLKAGNFVEISGGNFSAADLANKVAWINGMIDWTVIAAGVITIFDAAGAARFLLRGKRAKPAAIPSAM